MKVTKRTYLLIFLDWLTALIAWVVFFYVRKVSIEQVEFQVTDSFYRGVVLVPIGWVLLYMLQGTYIEVKRLYRMQILNLTFLGTLLGTLVLFFGLLLDDSISGYEVYYRLFIHLFLIHFLVTLLTRTVFVSIQVKRIHARKDGFRTLLLGGSDKAVAIYKEIQSVPKSTGNDIVGFVNLNGIDKLLEHELPYLGHADQLEQILMEHSVDEVIIALESTEHTRLNQLVSRLSRFGLRILVLPDMYDILSGSVKMSNLFGVILLEVNTHVMPIWQRSVKRAVDIVVSIVAMLLLSPLYLFLAIWVKATSEGPVFFRQERIGLNGKPFQIIKFRTMYVNAEAAGPQLSSTHDPRITPAGKIMRKVRLDEFPQFYNVLVGDMSLVGPRPERQFFIDQIVQREPQFLHLTIVRPGITSWGQVKFGYAENVDQMIQRMKFDLLYLKNMSLALDLKILLYTVLIVVKAKGK